MEVHKIGANISQTLHKAKTIGFPDVLQKIKDPFTGESVAKGK